MQTAPLLLSLALAGNEPAQDPRVEWFRHGWYAGGVIGAMRLDASGPDVDAALASLGYASTTSLTNSDDAFKMFFGYRTDGPWAFEISFDDMGQVSSSINASPPDINQFLADVATVHPTSGEGLGLRARYHLIDGDSPIWVSANVGGWLWNAELDSRATTGQKVTIDEDGVDPVVGVSIGCHVGRRVDLRLDVERFWLDGAAIDFVGFGMQFRLL